MIAVTLQLVGAALFGVGQLVVVLALGAKASTVRGRWVLALPWWAVGYAVATSWVAPLSATPAALAAVATWVGAPRLRGASEREWSLQSVALGCSALALLAATVAPWWAWLAPLVAVAAIVTIRLAQGREVRPQEVEPEVPEIVRRWAEVGEPRLSGTWDLDTWNRTANSCELVLRSGRADDATKLARLVEDRLRLQDGSVRFTPVDGKSVNTLRVQHLDDPIKRARRIDYADPTVHGIIDENGLLPLGRTTEDVTYHLMVFRPNGAAHLMITGASGSGKGGTLNYVATAMFRHPRLRVAALDLKGGTGIPALKIGADLYARTKDEWILAVEIQHDICLARQDRYAEQGWDSWSPTRDTGVYLVADEIWRMAQTSRAACSQLELVAAQGRSLGCGLVVASQRGDIGSMLSSPPFRSNVMGGGTAIMHKPGDSISGQLAAQDFEVDRSRLPKAPGWGFPLCSIDEGRSEESVRILHIPTQTDRDDGKPAPYGVVQEWGEMAVTDPLHPDDARIWARWDTSPAPAVDVGSLVVVPDDAPPLAAAIPAQRGESSGTTTDEPPSLGQPYRDGDMMMVPVQGATDVTHLAVPVGEVPGMARPSLSVINGGGGAGQGAGQGSRARARIGPERGEGTPASMPEPEVSDSETEADPTLRDRILAELRAATHPLTRAEVAQRTRTGNRRYVSRMLADLERQGRARRQDGAWVIAQEATP